MFPQQLKYKVAECGNTEGLGPDASTVAVQMIPIAFVKQYYFFYYFRQRECILR